MGYLVIDTFYVSTESAGRCNAMLDEGLYLVLDPSETSGIALPVSGEPVRVSRPDGAEVTMKVASAHSPHGVILLRLAELRRDEAPRGSRVSW